MMHESDAPHIQSEVVCRVVDRALSEAERPSGRKLVEIINETLFHEKKRLQRQSGREDERAFYREVSHQLGRLSDAEHSRQLHSIVERYAAEISGHFNPRIYKLATNVLPVGLTGLLNGISPGRLLRSQGRLPEFRELIELHGDVEHVRSLIDRGTVIFVPTHSSNLDSIIIGAAIFAAKLPPVTYGAGLNLFENRIIGYFMQNLGAYTVDRLKTDPLYREVLKEYSTVALEYNRHSLFFPGGTRSRSGGVETRLKKGLLGTAVTAYRNNLMHGRDDRVFIVPVTLNYPLVLEAGTLIDDHLMISGQSRYIIMDDEFSRIDRWLAYARGLFALNMHIMVRFGEPLDPFGNPVTPEGESLDPGGRVIEPSGYLKHGGDVVEDDARDAQYTRHLADQIAAQFMDHNTICTTHVVCYAAMEEFFKRFAGTDLYRFLRSLGPEKSIEEAALRTTIHRVLAELGELQREGRIKLGKQVEGLNADHVLKHGMERLATYHTRPVLKAEGPRVFATEPNLMFYYRNRLEGYPLTGAQEFLRPKEGN